MNFTELLLLATLCNIAYVDDAAEQQKAVQRLGLSFLDRYENKDHQAFVAKLEDRNILAISGTRFSDGNIRELLDDEDVLPSENPEVMEGFYSGGYELFGWANKVSTTPLIVTGHSLGGARTHTAPLFLPKEKINALVSFAAPKAATEDYWDKFSAPLTRVVHARDLWVGWPFLGEWKQPEPMLWLHDSRADNTTQSKWPGGLNAVDHSITNGYMRSLQLLAAGN